MTIEQNRPLANQNIQLKWVPRRTWRRIWTNNTTVVCIQLWPLFTEEGSPHSHYRRTGIKKKKQRNTSCKAEGTEKSGKGKQDKGSSLSDWRRGRCSLRKRTFRSFVSEVLVEHIIFEQQSALWLKRVSRAKEYEVRRCSASIQRGCGTEFLEYTERQIKTRTGAEPKNTPTVKPKMFSVPGSDRDPVCALNLCASRKSELMNSEPRPEV